jgi:hypothetical protein
LRAALSFHRLFLASFTVKSGTFHAASAAVIPGPVPRQQLVDALGGMIRQACEHVGEPCLLVDVVDLGGGDQRVDGSGKPAAFIRRGLIVPGFRRRKSQSSIRFIR